MKSVHIRAPSHLGSTAAMPTSIISLYHFVTDVNRNEITLVKNMKKTKFWKSVLALLGIIVLILVASYVIYTFNGVKI